MAVIILTGASRGIGAAIAETLLTHPETRLVAVARLEQPLRALEEAHGDRVAYVVGDLTDPATATEAVAVAVSRFGRIDSVVANAGALDPVAPVAAADLSAWRKLFDINFFSVVDLVSKAMPELRKAKGNVVFVSSDASTDAFTNWGAYCASKAAVNSLAKAIAAEEPLVSAISVAPGVVDTQMQQDIREVFGTDMTPEGLKQFTDLKTNNQLVTPDVPGTVYANLALHGWSAELNGEYFRYCDSVLESYALNGSLTR